jgi:hypothetical protein
VQRGGEVGSCHGELSSAADTGALEETVIDAALANNAANTRFRIIRMGDSSNRRLRSVTQL